MTAPFGGQDLVTADPISHRLGALVEATYPVALSKGIAGGVAALNGSGKVVNAAGVAVTEAADVAAAVANRREDVLRNETTGVYPPRPATAVGQGVNFVGLVWPGGGGSYAGGGGMVDGGKDMWYQV